MALAVIGAGFGRTGTFSLNAALEILGLGPCHHMMDVATSEFQKKGFRAAGRGEAVDWDTLYAGFRSAVDWPTAYFWRTLADKYPDARIILTVRDPDAWWWSFSRTLADPVGISRSDPESFGIAVIHHRIFSGRSDEEAHSKAVFEAHNAAVQAAFSPERLLVFDVRSGWAPLCAFLDVPVPETPFPASNTTADYRARFAPPQ